MLNSQQKIDWVLRLAIFGEFLGHGMFAIQGKQQWEVWIQQMLHVSLYSAAIILFWIGVTDVILAILVLFVRRLPRAVLLWMAVWGFWTALLRPIMNEPFWDFVERWANWGAPLALLLLRGWPKAAREWVSSQASHRG